MEEITELKERLEGERPVEWEGFPDIGLYMDQLINYMPRQLIHYGEGEALTSAMVNNYIKDGAMPRAGEEDLPGLAMALALRSYADKLACQRILELLRAKTPQPEKKQKSKP